MNVVITGASKGIGYEMAKLFALNGHRVIAVSRNANLLKSLEQDCAKINNLSKIETVTFDLESESYAELIHFIYSRFDAVNIVINNAGLLVNKAFQQLTVNDIYKVYNVNVFSAFKLIGGLLPLLKKGESHILNISSMGGFQGASKFAGLSAYSSSKGALATLTECMAEEFKPLGISVNCLCLGAVQTEMLNEAFPGYVAPVNANDMAKFIFEFAINGIKYFNGKILPVSLSTP